VRLGSTTGRIAARQSSINEKVIGWKSYLRSAIALLVLISLAIVFYKVVLKRSIGRPAFSSTQIARLTSTGKSRLAAISPDGKYVVHVADEAGREGLWIRQVATTSNVQIVAPADVEFQGLTFSPDGTFVYYVAHEKSRSIRDLYQVSALGGGARKLISNVDTAVTFSPDGKRIAFVRRFSDRGEDSLIVANADGSGEQKLLTRRQPDFFSMSGPAWSPDGKMIAAGAGRSDKDGRYMTVVGVDVANGTEKPLTAQRWTGVGRVAWRGPQGNDLLINALDHSLGLYQIWLISMTEGNARRVTNDLSDYRDLSLTADAGILAATQSDQLSSLWSVETATAEGARQITSGKFDGYYGLAWMPDGQVIYSSSNGSNHDVWQMDGGGRDQRQLTVDARSNVWPTVSPDGRYIVFTSDRTGTLHLWRMERDGSHPIQLTRGSGEDWASFSPDGRSVVYTVIGGLDRFTLWQVSIDGGEPVRLTEKFALQASVSPDGQLIACGYRPDANAPWKLGVLPISGGKPTQSFDIPQSVDLPVVLRWTPDGRALTYIDTRNGVSNLWLQPIAGGPPRQLSNWTSEQVFAFAWSRDGKRLMVSRGSRKDDIVLIRDSQ
jgi:Tol biopolymer transport system component